MALVQGGLELAAVCGEVHEVVLAVSLEVDTVLRPSLGQEDPHFELVEG